MSAAEFLSLERYGFHFPDGREALRDISFAMGRAESVALLGGNGAGKTTLLWCLAGLLFGKGAIRFEGTVLDQGSSKTLRGRVGLLFQNPDDQIFCPTVLEDVAFGPEQIGLNKDERDARVREALAAAGIADLADRPPHHLSMGQKKRVAVAGMLAMRPDLLLLDEPTGHLDGRGRREFLELVANLPGAKLVATHDLEFARRLCPRALLLHEGRLLADEPTGHVLERDDLLRTAGLF